MSRGSPSFLFMFEFLRLATVFFTTVHTGRTRHRKCRRIWPSALSHQAQIALVKYVLRLPHLDARGYAGNVIFSYRSRTASSERIALTINHVEKLRIIDTTGATCPMNITGSGVVGTKRSIATPVNGGEARRELRPGQVQWDSFGSTGWKPERTANGG